jgi:hypothetical protein
MREAGPSTEKEGKHHVARPFLLLFIEIEDTLHTLSFQVFVVVLVTAEIKAAFVHPDTGS